jgi:hypothetical protein
MRMAVIKLVYVMTHTCVLKQFAFKLIGPPFSKRRGDEEKEKWD